MKEFVQLLAVAVASGGLALLGVHLTNRHNLQLQLATRREQSQIAQRGLIIDVLVVGREWADTQLVLVPAMSRFSDSDYLEFVDTDTGVRLRELRRNLDAALIKSTLAVTDQDLRMQLQGISDFVAGFADEVNGPILRERGELDPVLNGITAIRSLQSSLLQLQTTTVLRLPPQ